MLPRISALGSMLPLAAALAVALPAGAGASGAATPRDRPALLTIGGPATRQSIAPDFLGLSFEYWAVTDYAGPDPHRVNPVFLQLIRNVTGSAPVLRIGGDTTDDTWWPTPRASKPAGIVYDLTRPWIATIGALANKLGARLILGIDLEADSTQVAAAEARALIAGIGRQHVEALELGNEPELYNSFDWGFSGAPGRPKNWDFAAFDRDFTRIGAALPRLPLAGPVVGQPNWFGYTNRFLSDQPRVSIVTLHRYPLQQCFLHPSQIKYPSIAHLLAPANSRGLADSVAGSVKAAHAHHATLRIDEMNSLSCGEAPAVTNSFASALWSLDVLFEMARVGVDGVNVHTYPGASSQLFTFTRVHGRWRAAVEPDYYGLAMFAQAAPPGSRLLRVSPAGPPGLETWATRAPDGTLRVTLINEGTRTRVIAVRAPAGVGAATGRLERLQAPSITATGRVTLAGQRFGAASGLPVGRRRTAVVAPRNGRYTIRVPAASAALLTVG
jgi:Glycosyl hydrolase family 79 C-terminal beta domain